jgi:prepilin-type N-terminal cleavage/methylation domain-containing protein
MKYARRSNRQRGDTLIEVVMALAILALTLTGAFGVVTRAFQMAQTAGQRTMASYAAQDQMEAIRALRGNLSWDEFLHGRTGVGGFKGVLTAGAPSGCRVQPNCFHMERPSSSLMYVPVEGSTTTPVPDSYLEVVATPDVVPNTRIVTFRVSWGFKDLSGGPENTNHFLTQLVNLDVPVASTAGPGPCVELPKDIIMVLDASHSMTNLFGGPGSTRADVVRNLTDQFIDNAGVGGGPLDNRMALIEFNFTPTQLAGFNSATGPLHTALGNYFSNPLSGTLFTPALNAAAAQFTANGRPSAVKVLVFLTDGNLGIPDTAAAAIATANVMKTGPLNARIYTIGVANPGPAADALLSSMAGNGGSYGSASVQADLDAILDGIANTLECP